MLALIILLALYALVLWLADLPTVGKIKAAPDADTARRCLGQLLRKRRITFAVFAGLLAVKMIYSTAKYVQMTDEKIVWITIAGWHVLAILLLLLYTRAMNRYSGARYRVTEFTADEFLASGERFILLQQGSGSTSAGSKGSHGWEFSAELLSRTARKGLGLPVCSIVQTPEQPAFQTSLIRLTAKGENPEEEVSALMRRAEKIVFLLNDGESCRKQIETAAEMPGKCIFVIGNAAEYEKVCSSLAGVFTLPAIPEAASGTPAMGQDTRRFYFGADGVMKEFSGEPADYCTMLGLPADAIGRKDLSDPGREPFYTRPVFAFLLVLAILKLADALINGNLG